VESYEELMEYENKAKDAGLNSYIVQDAGRTQVHFAIFNNEVEPGTITVGTIGPGDSDLID
jgi:peptidyl-tRNA hydrolase